MDNMAVLPPLLYLICAMSAMSFVVASGFWFLRWPEYSFQRSIWMGQIHGFVWAMILSIALGQSFQIFGEIVVLVLAIALGYRHVWDTLIFGGLCLVGWFITLGFGFVLFMLSGDLLMSVFVSGLLWLAPVFVLYRVRSVDDKVYNYLWPVLFAYFVLLVPLMIQKNVNTEEWQERKYSRPLRKA